MIPDQYHFLLIDLLIAVFPLVLVYWKKTGFPGPWKAVFTAIAVSSGAFLAWEELFTRIGVWRFNEQYLTGIYIGTLPMEAYLFFFASAFSFLSLYHALPQLVPRNALGEVHISITWFFLVCTVFLGTYFYPKLYTSACFFLTAILLGLQLFVFKSTWPGRFYLAFFAILPLFLVLDFWLTGAFTDEPIVWHNGMECMGIDLFTAPLEDIVKLLLFLMLTTAIYERSIASRRSSLAR